MKLTIIVLTIGLLILFTNCSNSDAVVKKPILLSADREAPLGWVYLTIYQDSSFEFVLTGVRSEDKVYKGRVQITEDSLFFKYNDSIPKAGNTAIYNTKTVAYVNGKYPERLGISLTKLLKK